MPHAAPGMVSVWSLRKILKELQSNVHSRMHVLVGMVVQSNVDSRVNVLVGMVVQSNVDSRVHVLVEW